MPPPRLSLSGFLAQASATLRAPSAPLTVVVGNESADLDSVCAAIVYAYLASRRAPHVPLVNLHRDDLAIRPELSAVLARAGLQPDLLPTLSDLPATLSNPSPTLPDLPHPDAQDTPALKWLLVDHNVPTGVIARAAASPSGCIDHHHDEGFVSRLAQPRVIEPCGSCTSLVVTLCADEWAALSRHDTTGDAALAILALAPILADTSNLQARDLVCDKDRRAMALLDAKLRSFDRAHFYAAISAAMADLSGLSVRDILRKDYKQWGGLGISSIGQSLPWLVSKAGGRMLLLDALASWARHRRIQVLAVMTLYNNKDGDVERQLLVWGFGAAARPIVTGFAHSASGPLRLKPWPAEAGLDHDDAENLRFVWSQGNCKASRKIVAPMLRDAFKL